MLLSFAQFEREVTGERIRDKIAASKRKGMWMGGPVPLGYDVDARKLVVNTKEADLVRHIYKRYLELGSVVELVDDLNRQGHRTKVQHRTSTDNRGGCIFRRGTLYHLLSNRIYLGQMVHKGEYFAGEHPAIIDTDLSNAVHAKLKDKSIAAIASRNGRCRTRLGKLAALGCLAPDIVTAIVEGRQPAALTARTLQDIDLPLAWADQRTLLGFA